MMALDRTALSAEALVDWRELRDEIVDNAERARVYGEMTGYFAQHDPVAFSEFVASQRKYRQRRDQAANLFAAEDDE